MDQHRFDELMAQSLQVEQRLAREEAHRARESDAELDQLVAKTRDEILGILDTHYMPRAPSISPGAKNPANSGDIAARG